MRNEKMTEREWLSLIQDNQPAARTTLFSAAGEKYGLSKRGVEKNIGQVVAEGLVEAIPDPGDARKRLYRLTKAGIALMARTGFTTELGSDGWGYRARQNRQYASGYDAEIAAVKVQQRKQRPRDRKDYNQRNVSAGKPFSNPAVAEPPKSPAEKAELEAAHAVQLKKAQNQERQYRERAMDSDEKNAGVELDFATAEDIQRVMDWQRRRSDEARVKAKQAAQDEARASLEKTDAMLQQERIAKGMVQVGRRWRYPEELTAEAEG